MQQQKRDGAKNLRDLLSYLRQDPNNDKLQAAVFDAALAAGEFPEANFQVAHARRLRPQDKAWRHREALLQLAQGKYAAAQETLTQLIDDGAEEPSTMFNLAYATFGLGDIEEALEMVEELRSQPGELGDLAWALWLRCEHRLGHLEEGLAAFIQAARAASPEASGVASLMALDANRSAEADRWSGEALARSPNQMEALVTRGTLALGRQDAAEATSLFERALERNRADGRSWSGLAFTRMLRGDFAAARTAFETSVQHMPDHIGTWLGLGWCEFFAGRIEAAKVVIEKALSLDRNFGESHGSLAVVLARQNAVDAAKREIDLALRLDRRNLSARYAEAILSGEADDPEAFRRLARRVLEQRSVGGDGTRTLADVVLGPRNRR
jgi:tetratricopeptide (TPR) repeat protein